MANDGSIMVTVEQAIADILAALEVGVDPDNKPVFKTAAVWDYQIAPGNGGIEAFVKYAPFAFVAFLAPEGKREGDYDLNEQLVFAVALGTVSKGVGDARKGDAKNFGISRLYDETIKALDRKDVSDGLCGDLSFFDSEKLLETSKSYCLQLYFKASLIRTNP